MLFSFERPGRATALRASRWTLKTAQLAKASSYDDHRQDAKGTRWMPWHQEPKKDVGICDKPGGVDNRALIPGCPNGETPHNAVMVIV